MEKEGREGSRQRGEGGREPGRDMALPMSG